MKPKWKAIALTAGLFSVLSLAMLWPLPLHMGTAIQDFGDPLHQVWTMRWIQHQLPLDPVNLFNGNIYYPFPLSLAYSDADIPAALMGWPVYLISGNAILSYNIVLVATFVLAGMAMLVLVWYLTRSYPAGLLSGLAYAFLPYRFAHMSHLNLLGHWCMPLILLALIILWRKRSVWAAALFGLTLAVQALTELNYLLVAGVGVALYLLLTPLLHRRALSWRAAILAMAALILAAAIVYPVVRPYRQVQAGLGFNRTLTQTESYAANPTDFISVTPQNWLWGGLLPTDDASPLFAGGVVVVMAGVGILTVSRRPEVVYFALVAVVSGLLTLGPTVQVGESSALALPYRWLFENVPGFTSMRDPSRFGALALLGVDALAGFGLAAVLRWVAKAFEQRRRQVLIAAAAAALIVAMLLESWAPPVVITPVDQSPAQVSAYQWLAARPDGGAVIEFPIWPGSSARTTLAMFESTLHWHPVFNGYAGFSPLAYSHFTAQFPGPAPQLGAGNVGILQDLGIRYALFHRSDYKKRDWQTVVGKLDELESLGQAHQVGDMGDVRVVELLPVERRKPQILLSVPALVKAGTTLQGEMGFQNDNTTPAVLYSGWLPRLDVQWKSRDGQLILRQDLAPEVPAVVQPGVTSIPLDLPAPNLTGDYLLEVNPANVSGSTYRQAVSVRAELPPAPPELAGPKLQMQARWDDRAYRPGEEIQIYLRWQVRGTLEKNYDLTAQLISSDDQKEGQHDGQVLSDLRPTSRWRVGESTEAVWLLPISKDAATGSYRLLLAMYSPQEPNKRLTVIDKTGRATENLWAGAVTVTR